MKNFNEVVIAKRKELGMTRYGLHKITGLNQQMLLNLEKNSDNTIKFNNVVKIAKALDIDLNIFKED